MEDKQTKCNSAALIIIPYTGPLQKQRFDPYFKSCLQSILTHCNRHLYIAPQ